MNWMRFVFRFFSLLLIFVNAQAQQSRPELWAGLQSSQKPVWRRINNSMGIISFATGQTFPGTGTGTVTSIDTGTGLNGGPITNTGTISISNGGVGTAQLADNSVTPAKINSGLASNGQILTANGNGGAAFQTLAALPTWGLNGNSGTACTNNTPCPTFLGTTDNTFF